MMIFKKQDMTIVMCRKRTGFTLTEVLVVLGILALLAAILLPVLSLVRTRARQSVCLSNLEQLHKAFAMYAADHDGFLPPYNNNITFTQNWSGSDRSKKHYPPNGDMLVASLWPYTRSRAIWFCPEDIFAHQNTLALPAQRANSGLFIDHRDSSYETGWWVGLIRFPARIDGIPMTDIRGRPGEMNPSAQVLLFDEEVGAKVCNEWAYSHGGWFNFLHLDGHVTSGKPEMDCAPDS